MNDTRQLAMDIVDGKVFGSWAITEKDMIGLVFMPLSLGAKIADDTAHVYEYYDKAAPRSINGYPIFFSMTAITTKEWPQIVKWCRKFERMKEIGKVGFVRYWLNRMRKKK